jgi:hypothetical protein
MIAISAFGAVFIFKRLRPVIKNNGNITSAIFIAAALSVLYSIFMAATVILGTFLLLDVNEMHPAKERGIFAAINNIGAGATIVLGVYFFSKLRKPNA